MRTKVVNGVTVALTAEENAERDAQELAWADGQPAREADAARCSGLDAAIAGDTTIAQLKAMTNAEFSAWWDANITTAAAAIAVLKRLARVMIRRVL